VVSGTLELRANVSETTWAEVQIDPPGSSVTIDPGQLRLIEPAADRSAERLAREYVRRGEGLVPLDDEEDDGPVLPRIEPHHR
jgi:hypothetical protein